jgi:hypothetical protein
MNRYFKNPISKDQVGALHALKGLTKEFRETAKWFGKPDDSSASEGMVLSMIRMPNPEPDPGKDRCLVAVDRRAHKGPPDEISVQAMGEFWSSRLRYMRPSPPDWYKAGAVIWDHLGFEVGTEWTAMMLGLDHADDDMTRACQAALFNAFAAGGDGVDLEPVLLALATFVHTHPCFSNVTPKITWHLPFGENTAYQAIRVRTKTPRAKSKMKHRP